MQICLMTMCSSWSLEENPMVLNHQIFAKIFEVSELYNMDKSTRDKILHKMTTERDLRNQKRGSIPHRILPRFLYAIQITF